MNYILVKITEDVLIKIPNDENASFLLGKNENEYKNRIIDLYKKRELRRLSIFNKPTRTKTDNEIISLIKKDYETEGNEYVLAVLYYSAVKDIPSICLDLVKIPSKEKIRALLEKYPNAKH